MRRSFYIYAVGYNHGWEDEDFEIRAYLSTRENAETYASLIDEMNYKAALLSYERALLKFEADNAGREEACHACGRAAIQIGRRPTPPERENFKEYVVKEIEVHEGLPAL